MQHDKAVSSPLSAFSNMRTYKGECMGKEYCVYCHISPSGKRYIGVTSRKPEKRWNSGLGYADNDYFSIAIKKYGWDSFKHIILFQGLTQKEASEIEKSLIAFYETTDRSKGYNIDAGGLYTDRVIADETRRKIGDSHRGRFTEAQREAIKTRKNPNYHHSDEIKKIIGDSHRGKPLSDEHKAKLSASHKGKRLSDEAKIALAETNMRRVLQYDLSGNLVGEYASLKEAADTCGVYYQGISACCRGKYSHCGGFVWRYAM